VIDQDGFRHGVGIILVNSKRQLFLAKRIGKAAWQFPQGGMKEDETPEQSMFRELKEEIGLQEEDVKILGCTTLFAAIMCRAKTEMVFVASGE
jgi:putative (di)nucleoside polyphosphate hydrolase